MTREELIAEMQEQARLLGMSATRELKLRTEIEHYRKVLQEIESKGHSNYHGRGYTLANIAQAALEYGQKE